MADVRPPGLFGRPAPHCGMMSVTKPETFDERLREASAMSGKQESREEKNHQLYLKQVELLKLFLEKRAISKEQYDKSFHDLSEKMGYGDSTK